MLYSGLGANPFCTQALENQLRDLSDDRMHTVCRFDGVAALGNEREIRAIIIPGGNANQIYFGSGLAGNEEGFIRKIDEHKIACYGACAGAILASEALYNEIPTPSIRNNTKFHEVGQSFLGLFPGKVIAPLISRSSQEQMSLSDFNILSIKSTYRDEPINSVHILGPAFLHAERVPRTEVLSIYAKPFNVTLGDVKEDIYKTSTYISSREISESIYHRRMSGAPILLTSSHPEIDSTIVSSEGFREGVQITRYEQKQLVSMMKVDDEKRIDLMKRNFEKIGIQCK